MLKVIFFNTDLKFGIYSVIKTLKHILKKKIYLINSNKILDIIFKNPDITHIHGCWRPYLFFVFLMSKLLDIKVVISPHGMLDPLSLSQKKIRKNIAWDLYQKYAFHFADLIIVNSQVEKLNVLKKINKKVKIIVLPHTIKTQKINFKKKKLNSNLKFVFFSRIHPSKNLHSLLNIWSNNNFFNNYNLFIYGKTDDKNYFKKISNKISRSDNIIYKGPIFKKIPEKLSKFDILIHPSKSENFGLVILEALNAGLYLLINKKLKWKKIEKSGFSSSVNIVSSDMIKKINQLEKKKEKLDL